MKFGKAAVKNPGKLHLMLGIPLNQEITENALASAADSADPKLRKSAQFQLNKMRSQNKYGIRPAKAK